MAGGAGRRRGAKNHRPSRGAFRPHRRGAGPPPGADRPFAGGGDREEPGPARALGLGGLIAKTLAGRGLSAATVAIEPAPFRGGLPLPVWTEAPVDAEAAERGPLLIISGERDHAAPPSVTRAAYERQKRNKHAVTEFVQLPRRDRSLPINSGWREVAQTALTFVRRFLCLL